MLLRVYIKLPIAGPSGVCVCSICTPWICRESHMTLLVLFQCTTTSGSSNSPPNLSYNPRSLHSAVTSCPHPYNNNNNPICKAPECQKTSVALYRKQHVAPAKFRITVLLLSLYRVIILAFKARESKNW